MLLKAYFIFSNVVRGALNASAEDELIFLPNLSEISGPLANLAAKIIVEKMRIFAPIIFTSSQVSRIFSRCLDENQFI